MGKRYHRLWPRVAAFDNLWLAFKKAARGKRSKPCVAAFEYDLEVNLLCLQAELRQGSYRPGAADGSLRRGAVPAGGDQRQPGCTVQ
jgi:hypothetical protein